MTTCKHLLAAALMVTGGFAAGQASAADSGGYVGGAIGQSRASIDGGSIDASLASLGFSATTSVDETDTGFKIYGGYQFNKNIAVEVDYVGFGKFAFTSILAGGSTTLHGEWKGHSIDLSVLGIAPLGESFTLFGRAGLGAWDAKVNVGATGPGGSAATNDSDSGVGALLGVGATYRLTPTFAVRAEIERHFSVGSDDIGGESDIDLISIGLQYHF